MYTRSSQSQWKTLVCLSGWRLSEEPKGEIIFSAFELASELTRTHALESAARPNMRVGWGRGGVVWCGGERDACDGV